MIYPRIGPTAYEENIPTPIIEYAGYFTSRTKEINIGPPTKRENILLLAHSFAGY
jgi:hypothetical protein